MSPPSFISIPIISTRRSVFLKQTSRRTGHRNNVSVFPVCYTTRIICSVPHTPLQGPTVVPPSKPTRSNILTTLTNAFPIWVLLGAAIALVHPPAFLWFKPTFIPPTLSLIMLGMGLTTPLPSLRSLISKPTPIIIGTISQYTVMPLLSTLISRLLALPPPLAAGLILVGVCPGGAASNVVSLLAGGDVPLSVLLTLCSTLLSVLLIPLLMSLLASALVPVQPAALLLSTAQVVLLPLLLGSLLQKLYPAGLRAVEKVLPLTSVLFVTLICAAIISANAKSFRTLPPKLIIAICTVHALGGLLGFLIARICGMARRQCRTVSIEVMMQNSSLAVSLAAAHFANPLTALPGAISATVHSILGSLLAGGWRIIDSRDVDVNDTTRDPKV